ncbi:MAG: lysophospholipid acyltransferase family protein [Gammaproteobacteria bacterium]|nr:lysophospholipid acyltransferase family protein [Pseudomonadales bacterium]MCP5346468.1 lysophospholipid acyltransferase family protein [Pseudomonadales bacterium]
MRTTVFSTPLLTPLLRLIAILVLRLMGWKAIGKEISNPKLVLIGAPHTSNWDFPLMLLVVLKLRLKVFWMGKNSLFRFPFGGLMRWLGGIPIDRSKSNNVVQQMTEEYARQTELVVLIPPEGTRSKVERWKTGFYHIARNAGVPILLGYVDAPKKEAGLADFFTPSDDLERDMQAIRDFYADKGGLKPENA